MNSVVGIGKGALYKGFLCLFWHYYNEHTCEGRRTGTWSFDLVSISIMAGSSRLWLQLMGYTSLAWLSRFAIVVAILVAFHCQGNMLVAWCRQWVMWMISILSPTPGGSGVAELMFRLYYADFLPDASVAILAAMLWRAIFYYPFLVMGIQPYASRHT